MVTKAFASAAIFLLCNGAAFSESSPPLSAIDWLSNSVAEEGVSPEVGAAMPGVSAPAAVQVLPLDAPTIDSVGVLDPVAFGVPADLWGRSSAGDLAEALYRVTLTSDAPPAIMRFMVQLLQAKLEPPIDAAVTDRFFYARVDRLLEKGHLDAANALLSASGITDPASFRRRFDIALLTENETEACREIEETPELSPTYPARIFCLARLGQFDVAALTLGNAETLGILTEDEDTLLLHFLDPELFEGEPIPQPPSVPTPLQFRLYEAVGERIATEGLPLPFAFADMSGTVGWKARLGAAERLAATGAIQFERMLDVYLERAPSASGGVWERVRALQDLVDAVNREDDTGVSEALPTVWNAARQTGYAPALATWLSPKLADRSELGRASHVAFEVALMAGDPESARKFSDGSREDRFLLSIAENAFGSTSASDVLGRAVLRGLSSVNAGSAYESLIADDRQGEALFRALDHLADGANGNPDTTAQSLAALRRLGLDDLARQIAVELVLKEGAA